jgi:hypothetical protein
MTYAHQKLKNAVEALRDPATSKRQWLAGNDVYHVLHLVPEELPHDVRADFDQLRNDDLVAGMVKNPGQQIDMAHNMSDADVERLAARIVELYYHVDAAIFSRAPHPRRTVLRATAHGPVEPPAP